MILTAADNPHVRRVVSKHGMRLGGSRFVAGETMEDSVRALRALNEKGLWANTTLLGESIRDESEARAVAEEYVVLVDRLASEGLRANVALKLTHLGLDIDEELAYENVCHVVERGSFIRIDMEQSAYVDATLRIYRRLREDGLDNVGTVLQSYLYRTEKDLESLLELRPNLRLVKGAYLEPADVAFPRKADVDANYFTLCTRLLSPDARKPGSLLHIATHDIPLADRLAAYIAQQGVPASAYEFAMLYGIQRGQQARLSREGRRLRVLISYGEYWFPWYMRRLAERPANMWFVVRTMFG